MNLKIKTSYSWEELADGTRTKPGSRFLAMLEDYVTWSKIDTGLPHRYDSVLAEHDLNRPLFLTDAQAKSISEGLVYLQFVFLSNSFNNLHGSLFTPIPTCHRYHHTQSQKGH